MRALLMNFARVAGLLTQLLDKFGGWIVLPLISAVMMMDVFLRYVLNDPTIWGLEFSQWFLILVFLSAIPECTRRHGHIRMELLYVVMPQWFKKVVTVLYCLVGIWIFWLLLEAEWEEFIFSLDLGRVTEYLELPIWIQHFALVVMSVIMIALFAVRAIGTLVGADPFPEEERDPSSYEE